MAGKEGQAVATPRSMNLLQTRIVVPIMLLALVLLYELVWKGRHIEPRSWAEYTIDLALFLIVGPVMAWWGRTMARLLGERLALSEAAAEEKSRSLEQRNRQLQTVLKASRAMTAVLDLRQVADLVVEQVVTLTRFQRIALILGPDERGEFSLAASRGLPTAFLIHFMGAMHGPSKGASPVEWCRVTCQPVVVESLAKDFRTAGMKAVFAQAGLEGLIAIPLQFGNQFRGALTVYPEKGDHVTTSEISLISALASQAAMALENARLYTLTAHQRTRLDQALEFLRSVAGALARSRIGVAPLLQLVAQATARLFAPARIQMAVTRSGRPSPITVSDSAGMEPGMPEELALTLPVSLYEEHYGTFEIYLGGEGRKLDADEVQILQAFVHLTASAMGSASVVAEMRQAVEEVERAYMGTLEALIKALEMRDHETEGHSRRVVQYTLSMAQKLGVPESQLVPIMRGSLLHDVGKIGIPDAILRKAGPLDEEDWKTMRQHPRIGYEMLRGIEFLKEATPIILYHHERWDGSGYPEGLSGEAIPLGARIFAVADAYDAITSDRPYRKGRSHEHAVAEIAAGAGRQFDAKVVEVLLTLPEEEMARIRGRAVELVHHM